MEPVDLDAVEGCRPARLPSRPARTVSSTDEQRKESDAMDRYDVKDLVVPPGQGETTSADMVMSVRKRQTPTRCRRTRGTARKRTSKRSPSEAS